MRIVPSLTAVIVLLAVTVGLLVTLDHAPRKFDPAVLQNLVTRLSREQAATAEGGEAVSLQHSVVILQQQLKALYPDLIHVHDEWLFNLAGGFKTGLLLLHASLTEYVAVWGSAVPSTGHSGRNWAEFHDWIISGNGSWWREGGVEVSHHSPYSYLYTPPFAGRIVHLQAGTFMLELCKGVIPALLPFGLADGLVSSLDPLLVWRSIRLYGRLTLDSLSKGQI